MLRVKKIMKKAILIAAAAALLLVGAVPALPEEQVAFKVLGGLAQVQGDDYNKGILGAYEYTRDTSDSLSGSYKTLKSGTDFQAEIINYWGYHIGIGIGGGYYRVTNASGVTGTASVPDPTYQFSSTYIPKISVIPFFINLHYKVPLASRIGLDVFAGPVFQVIQFGFRREATSSLNSLSELETFNASGTALGFQGGLSFSCRILRGIALVADGFYRSSKVSNIKGNWFLTSTSSSGTVTNSSSSYYLWAYNDSQGAVYPRIGFFDANGPTGGNISDARKANLNLSGVVGMIGLKFSI
jgi:hypothetical protein